MTDATTQPLDPDFLSMLVCPESHKPLVQRGDRLLCKESGKAYRIVDGIPNLIVDEAERITDAELATL
ncbi:MAG: Trm112 family protein [Planctomycetes bacterium]|nr:Trm112 family protein [Planctomycetota bacterium]